MIHTAVFGVLALVCIALTFVEAVNARYWRGRAGRWFAHKVAGVFLWGCLAVFFVGAAIS